jgi:class 3 adenylate cyclase
MSQQSGEFDAPRRTLAAIVFTDVANFSALMSHNEDRTLALVKRDLKEIGGICEKFQGKVLKSTGDGLLMYFDSAVQAVACALHVQQVLSTQAKSLLPEEALGHRIGIHLGDVFVSEKDVMGDGVNVAARLQAEAEPGGIAISQTVYDVVKNRLAVTATCLGPRELKNIKDAIPVYQILLDAAAGAVGQGMPRQKKATGSRGKWIAIGAGVVVVLGALVPTWIILARLDKTTSVAPSPAAPAAAPTPVSVAERATSTAPFAEGLSGGGKVVAWVGSQPANPAAPAAAAGGAAVAVAPAGASPELDAKRLECLTRYNFTGMLAWLDKNKMKDSPVYARYRKLSGLNAWTQATLQETKASRPLIVIHATPQGEERYEVWQDAGGRLTLKGPQSIDKQAFSEIRPSLMVDIYSAAISQSRGDMPAPPSLAEAVGIFRQEAVSLGLMK